MIVLDVGGGADEIGTDHGIEDGGHIGYPLLVAAHQAVEDLLKDDKSGLPAWALRREYRSSYRGELAETERITAGKFIGRVAPGEKRVPISVEESLAKDLQLKLGDELTFDVQGVPLTVYVASLRAV